MPYHHCVLEPCSGADPAAQFVAVVTVPHSAARVGDDLGDSLRTSE